MWISFEGLSRLRAVMDTRLDATTKQRLPSAAEGPLLDPTGLGTTRVSMGTLNSSILEQLVRGFRLDAAEHCQTSPILVT